MGFEGRFKNTDNARGPNPNWKTIPEPRKQNFNHPLIFTWSVEQPKELNRQT